VKQINPEEAASWSDEEYAYNVAYLRDRSRWTIIDQIEAVRAAKAAAPKRAKKVVEDEED
jgi:hypothetical protein